MIFPVTQDAFNITLGSSVIYHASSSSCYHAQIEHFRIPACKLMLLLTFVNIWLTWILPGYTWKGLGKLYLHLKNLFLSLKQHRWDNSNSLSMFPRTPNINRHSFPLIATVICCIFASFPEQGEICTYANTTPRKMLGQHSLKYPLCPDPNFLPWNCEGNTHHTAFDATVDCFSYNLLE